MPYQISEHYEMAFEKTQFHHKPMTATRVQSRDSTQEVEGLYSVSEGKSAVRNKSNKECENSTPKNVKILHPRSFSERQWDWSIYLVHYKVSLFAWNYNSSFIGHDVEAIYPMRLNIHSNQIKLDLIEVWRFGWKVLGAIFVSTGRPICITTTVVFWIDASASIEECTKNWGAPIRKGFLFNGRVLSKKDFYLRGGFNSREYGT